MSSIKHKRGICLQCTDGIERYLISNLCQTHYWKSRASPKDEGPRKPIPRISAKHQARLAEYSIGVRKFKRDKPMCEFPGCTAATDDCHHPFGRIGKRLLDFSVCIALCRLHHIWVETHPKAAKEMKLSGSRLNKNQ